MLTLLVLLAALLVLAGFLLTALLLTGLRLSAALLATLLLLAGLLVWILIHRSLPLKYWFEIASKRDHLERSRPIAGNNAEPGHSFPFKFLLNFKENEFGTCRRCNEFPSGNEEDRRWDAICFCGCSGCQSRFWC